MTTTMRLDLSRPATVLTADLVDWPSVSGDEAELADAVEAALRTYPALAVRRIGNVVLARTDLGRDRRVILAGHLDTVPIADNVPSRVEDGVLYGCGSSDMKSGVAVQLRVAHLVGSGTLDPGVDLTWVFYDCEEIEADRNGLNRLSVSDPAQLRGDLAILLEGTDGIVEGGCQGTMRVRVTVPGVRAHSARSWLGSNAIHATGEVLRRLQEYVAVEVDVEGLRYREGMNAVAITGGVAGNVVPDSCVVTVNYRFAPDKTEAQAEAVVRELFGGYEVTVTDSAPAARPGLDSELCRQVVEAFGGRAEAKLGWTDVARFATLGIPALNLGPGDPNLAHKPEESVELARITAVEDGLVAFLRGRRG